jgi:hypothetical protein
LTTGSTAPGTSTRCRSVINKSSTSVPLTPNTSIPLIKGVNAVPNDQILPEGHGNPNHFSKPDRYSAAEEPREATLLPTNKTSEPPR